MNKDVVAEMSQQYQVDATEKLVPEGYKQTEVGVTNSPGANLNATSGGPQGGGMDSRRIPEGWEMAAFGTLSKLISERINPKVHGGDDFCIELEHIEQGKGLLLGETQTTERSSLKSVFAKEDVLFGKLRAYLRKYWLADRSGVCSTEIWVFRAEKNKAVPSYIYQVVQTDSFIELASEGYGTHMPRSDWNIVKEFQVAVPPIHEQTAIANALSDVDALLSELEKLIAKKQAIKTATMQQLLTGRTRLPQFAHHPDGSKKGYKQSELGEIPEDWDVISFDDVALRINIKKNQISASDYQSYGSYPVVDQGKKKIVGYSDLECKVFKVSDAGVIVFGDHTCIVKYVDFSFLVGADGVQVISGREGCNTRFLSYVMSFFPVEPTGYNRHYGALREFVYSFPKQEEQTAIATILSDMDEEIQALEQRLNKTRQIKQGMMQELLTGRIRLLKLGRGDTDE